MDLPFTASVAIMVFLASFAAGLELSQVRRINNKRWSMVFWWLLMGLFIGGGIWLSHVLEPDLPGQLP